MMIYYHGSSHCIKQGNYLHPRKAGVIDGEKAVFATNELFWATFFISESNMCDIESGYINNKPYILEQYPGAINKFLAKKKGYIYELDSKDFHDDKRLGLRGHEFISHKKVKVLKVTKILDLLKALKKTKINIITFDMKMEAIDKCYLRSPFYLKKIS